ncbi:MAG: glycosyltransferase family 2 protein [Candidatus Levybacteria bacterium]|nr:glycosyltransferase family 2 protein [Candidatus Levybacteria bacterium]
MNKNLSIIIISYNTKQLLKECIDSVVETVKNHSFEIIVVDNASTDGSAQKIKNEKLKMKNDNLKLKIIENEKNVGFSRANNIGVKKAEGKYILFLNPDTVVCEKAIDSMVDFMEKNEEVGAATCRVELPNGRLDDACHRGFPTPLNSFFHFSGVSKLFPRTKLFSGYSLGYLNLSKTHEIDALCGAFMIVRRKAGEEINWWDEDYFWYGEDLDFCYRLKKKGPSVNSGQGWKIFYVPQVSILHYKGASGGIKSSSAHLTKADSQTKKLATKARFDAMRIFYSKHYKDTYPGIVNWLIFRGIDLRSRLS